MQEFQYLESTVLCETRGHQGLSATTHVVVVCGILPDCRVVQSKYASTAETTKCFPPKGVGFEAFMGVGFRYGES